MDIERELVTKLDCFCCTAPKGAHVTLMLLYFLSMLARKHNSLNYFLLVLEHYSIFFIQPCLMCGWLFNITRFSQWEVPILWIVNTFMTPTTHFSFISGVILFSSTVAHVTVRKESKTRNKSKTPFCSMYVN